MYPSTIILPSQAIIILDFFGEGGVDSSHRIPMRSVQTLFHGGGNAAGYSVQGHSVSRHDLPNCTYQRGKYQKIKLACPHPLSKLGGDEMNSTEAKSINLRASQSLLRLWFFPGGRASLFDLWIKTLLPVVMSAFVVDAAFPMERGNAVYYVFMSAWLWPLLNVYIKRLHDRSLSGWYFLLAGIPLVNILVFIEIFFLPGEARANSYDLFNDPDAEKISTNKE